MAVTAAAFGALSVAGAAVLLRLARPEPGYRPGEEITGLTAALDRDLPEDHPTASFLDVTERAGIGFQHFPGRRMEFLPKDMGSGAGWADYDGDGWLDLLLVNIGGPSRLYRNRGDGTFEDVTSAVGMSDREGFWAGATWGDYDRDGHLDLYVTGYVEYEEDLTGDVSLQYDVEIPPSLNPSSFRPHANLLWHNEGNGTFREVGEVAGVRGEGRSLGAVWADFDEDGWPDLYVANDVSDNVLYRNLGDGKFEDVSHQASVADYRGAMGLAVGDWDGDEDLDLFITHWIAQENALFTNLASDLASASGDVRPLRFVDEADRVGLGQIALDFVGWGTFFFDYNQDGLADLFVANGSTLQRRDAPSLLVPMRDQLFWNRGREKGFYDVSVAAGEHFSRALVGRGAAVADYDRDGDMDLVVINHGERPSLLRNESGRENAWLQVHLEGSAPNTSAIGARVRLVTGESAQVRVVGAQTSYLSHNSLVQHFGLGAASRVDTLTVLWPEGSSQTWADVPTRRAIRLIQGSSDWQTEWVATAGPEFWELYRLAERHRIEGRQSEAAAAYEGALVLNPLHENTLYYLASVRMELGEYSAAERALTRLLEIAPESARAHTQIGVLRVCPGPGKDLDPLRARTSFMRASSINPEQTGSSLWLSMAALLDDQIAEAGRHLDQVLLTNSESVPAVYLRGYVSWMQNQTADAALAIERVLELATASRESEGLLEGDTHGARPVFAGGVSCPWLEDQLSWLARPVPTEGIQADRQYRTLRDALQDARRGQGVLREPGAAPPS